MFKKNASDLLCFKNLTGLNLASVLWLLITLIPALCRAEFKDPTKPDYSPSTAIIKNDTAITADKLVLSAIWITATAKWATINGITAKQGQTILNDVKLIKITRNAVSLNHNGNIKTLRLLKSPYKTK
jgi:hypothetical protein